MSWIRPIALFAVGFVGGGMIIFSIWTIGKDAGYRDGQIDAINHRFNYGMQFTDPPSYVKLNGPTTQPVVIAGGVP